MAGRMKNSTKTEVTRSRFLEKAYELFTTKNIESVSMIEVAKACNNGTTTLYRYYSTKQKLVVAVATWKWEEYLKVNQERRPSADFRGMTAVEVFEFFLDSFLEMYRNHRDMLRFNQFFNIYIQSEHMDLEVLKPYQEIIRRLAEQFHVIYLKAELDGTIRTDVPEVEMFSAMLHLMLAAVTRYAVGLVYKPESGFDEESELKILKEALLWKYRSK